MLKGKVVAVTGGSGGIGSAICRAFANAGATVIVAYNNNEQRAKDVVASLKGEGHWSHYVPVDISAALKTDVVHILHHQAMENAAQARQHRFVIDSRAFRPRGGDRNDARADPPAPCARQILLPRTVANSIPRSSPWPLA